MQLKEALSRDEMRGVKRIVVFVSLLMVMRFVFPERTLDYVGPRALLDAAFALGFLGLILVLAAGLGTKVLNRLDISTLSGLKKSLFSLAVGLGVLAYGVMALGLLSILNPIAIYIWLVFAALIAWRELANISNRIPAWLWRHGRAFGELAGLEKGFLILAGLIFSLSAIQALAPPTGNDTLMYHLQGPRLFLEAEKITLLPDNLQANFPMTIEMIFTIGLVVGSDVFAKLVHLTYAGLVLLGCFSLGRHLLGNAGGWLSAVILLGIPIFPFLGTLANADMPLVYYTLLAIYALILWTENGLDKMVVLSGLMIGWAMGSKYTALGIFGVLVLWILWQRREAGTRHMLMKGIVFGLPALLIAAPWYLKNWVLSGNPVFPFFFGGPLWDGERLSEIMAYLMDGYGSGRSVADYIALPINIYLQQESFTFSPFDFPSFLFPLVFLYPWARRYKNIDWIASAAFALFIFWALGSQQIRFLLPIYPLLSVMVALVLLWLGTLIKKQVYRRTLSIGLLGGFLVATLGYQALYLAEIRPHPVVFGVESKRSFLKRAVHDYPALQYVERNLDANVRILMLWDGKGYYCDQRCLPDTDQSRLIRLTKSNPDPRALASDLRTDGVTHILSDFEGLATALLRDPDRRHERAAKYFFEQFAPLCGEKVFEDSSVILYQITCK